MTKLALIAFVVGAAHVAAADETKSPGNGSDAPAQAAPAVGAPPAAESGSNAARVDATDADPSRALVAPAPAVQTAPPPAPEPTPSPAPSSPPAQTVTTHDAPDDYYARDRGVGIFHNARLVASVMNGTTPDLMNGAVTSPGATRGVTVISGQFDGTYLGLPSAFGNFHGIDVSAGVRSEPIDLWLQLGTAVTLLNVGHGAPGSIRVGGGFGFGFNFAHAYGYVKARAAMVIIPRHLDVEANAQWTPPSASTENYDERLVRVSAWYRPGGSERAYEVFVESLRREDALADRDRELDAIGAGVGMTLF